MTIALGLRTLVRRVVIIIIFVVVSFIFYPATSIIDFTNSDIPYMILLIGIFYTDEKFLKE